VAIRGTTRHGRHGVDLPQLALAVAAHGHRWALAAPSTPGGPGWHSTGVDRGASAGARRSTGDWEQKLIETWNIFEES
jgi:hypothetical protein